MQQSSNGLGNYPSQDKDGWFESTLLRQNKSEIMTKQVFLGNGDESMARCYELHKKMDECFSHISGIQQGCLEFDMDDIEPTFVIFQNAKFIFESLTGKKLPNMMKLFELEDKL